MADKYCLSNFIDYSTSIHEPLKHSNRIKYSCFDISPNYLVFGATSGSLYLFNRRTAKFLHLIPNKHGSVSHLAISANEKYVAFGTLRSIICVYTINLSANATPQVIYTNLSTDQSVQVTCLRWTQDEKQFYYGDSKGLVNMVVLSSFIGRGLINMTVHTILFLETPIVQIDVFESLLLVSSYSKCLLCNTEFEDYKQIGNRPREGLYGACFAVSSNEATQPSRIYCARPGSRLWEADFEGDVIQTHQFRAALAIAPTKIYKFDLETKGEIDNHQYCDYQSAKFDENNEMLDYQPQNLQFSKLQMLTSDFLLTYTEFGLYVFDVNTSKVVLWCNQFERIVDCRVSGENIVIFAQTGSLYSVELCSLQAQVCRLVQDDMLLECAFLMRKHVKYFADKARDDYSLSLLKDVKNFLIDRQQYELLNDLSVIFDAIVQCAGDGDNNSSGGSSGGTGDRSSLGASGGNYKLRNNEEYIPSSKGVYVLENAFCDNLKNQKSTERHLKDTLLTVTGKFGKNIIKYKFSIFADEQEKLVSDLIPSNERSLPFKDINIVYEQQDDDIVRLRKSRNPTRTGKNSSSQSIQEQQQQQQQQRITTEEKTLYNLYLIFKSAKISNTNCVERYRALFDEYSAREIIVLLSKLQSVMQEYGDSLEQAQKNCYEMYLNYLNPELIWEMDEVSRDYIATGFKELNTSDDIVRCDNCLFPLRFDNSCQFNPIGTVLLRYYWTRNEQAKCFDVLTHVPALLDVLATFYLNEQRMDKVLPIVLNYGQPELLFETGKYFSLIDWTRCFQQFVDMQMGRLTCVNCACITVVQNVNRHFFYTWNCFLSIAVEHMKVSEILALILKWSHCIPNDAIDREFYTKCLLKG